MEAVHFLISAVLSIATGIMSSLIAARLDRYLQRRKEKKSPRTTDKSSSHCGGGVSSTATILHIYFMPSGKICQRRILFESAWEVALITVHKS